MIGKRLKRARGAAGLSMLALGTEVGISANMVKKYEHDISMPNSEKLIKLSKALGVRSEYFFRPFEIPLGNIEYRKRANTPKKILKRIEADVLNQAERWLELANLWPVFPAPDFSKPQDLPDSINSMEDVERCALSIRTSWDLGSNPIPNLVDTLESKGILVIITDVDENAKFDGMSVTVATKPVVVISNNWPGDRQRFTLAHELGHLLMHEIIRDNLDEEKACNHFASCFLLPASELVKHLGSNRRYIEMRELYLLKQDFGLSMQACLYRAAVHGIIDEATRRKTFMIFSKNGWRKKEPGDQYPQESTLLFRLLVYRALGEKIIGESKAAELLGKPLMQFHQERKMVFTDAAAH